MQTAEIIDAQASVENETYWRHHAQAQPQSKLSMSAYCKQHKVHYARFIYWSRKFAKPKSSALVKVQIKPAVKRDLNVDEIRCTLVFKNNSYLRIESLSVLKLILAELN